MNALQATFYLDVIRVYREKGVPEEMIDKVFDLIFIELSLVDPDDLELEHTNLMEVSQLHYADIENFRKADLIKKTREMALEIFKARDAHLKTLKEIKNKQDEENTD
tara:strand:- start:213 stop:533 length:321 start_codon:yes stop_codon:yes gene_type:complete